MEHAVLVAERGALEQLVHEAAHSHGVEGAAVAVRVHILFEVLLAELKDEHKLGLGVDDVVQADYVGVFELFHEGYFANGGRGGALLGIEVDLLEGDDFVGGSGSALGEDQYCEPAERRRSVLCRR